MEHSSAGCPCTTTDNSDSILIGKCLAGDQDAWAALIDKYRRLIFSIPLRVGSTREEAAEIFQQVCLTLLSGLARLRDHRSLAAWLIQVTSNECRRRRYKQRRLLELERDACRCEAEDPEFEHLCDELLREQMLRDAVSEMAPQCRCLIDMLFFATPALPYDEVARRMGVTKGSVSFIRRRCLERLRRTLEEKGFR